MIRLFERRQLVVENSINLSGAWEKVEEKYVVNSIDQFCSKSRGKFEGMIQKLFNGRNVKTRNYEYRCLVK